MSKQDLNTMPSLHSDEEAENFMATADLTEYKLIYFTVPSICATQPLLDVK